MTETIVIRISPETKAVLQRMADSENRKLAQWARITLENVAKQAASSGK